MQIEIVKDLAFLLPVCTALPYGLLATYLEDSDLHFHGKFALLGVQQIAHTATTHKFHHHTEIAADLRLVVQ